MKKFIALALVVCLFLISALPVAAAFTDVSVARVTYSVYTSGSSVGSALLTGYPPSPQQIRIGTNTGLTASNIFRITDSFLAGAEYELTYVIFDPDATYTASPQAILYQPGTSSTQQILNITRTPLAGNSELQRLYPNPFGTSTGVSDSVYVASSYVYTINFTPEFSNVQLDVVSSVTYAVSDFITVGLGYYNLSTTYEESYYYFLDGIFGGITDIVTFLSSTLNNTLTSIRSAVVDGFDQVHEDLVGLTGAIGQGFQMTEEDEEDFNELDSDQESFSNSSAGKQQQQNAALQQQQAANQDKQNQVNDLTDQEEHFKEVESDFKSSYGDSADFKDINASINNELTGEYGSAIIWWGEVFGALFSFAPLTFMLNVSVFFSLLMILFGVAMRSGFRVSARERREAEARERREAERAKARDRRAPYRPQKRQVAIK